MNPQDIQIPEEVDKNLSLIANTAATFPEQKIVFLNYMRMAYKVGFVNGQNDQADKAIELLKPLVMPAEVEK